MTCPHCTTEIYEDGTIETDCPIDCLPIRGKWQRLAYAAIRYSGATQNEIINRLRIETDEDVRQQYVQRAVSSLLKHGHIQRNWNAGNTDYAYVTTNDVQNDTADTLISEASELSRKELRQIITHLVLSVKEDTEYHVPSRGHFDGKVPAHIRGRVGIPRRAIARVTCGALEAIYPDSFTQDDDWAVLYENAEPSVIRARKLLTDWKKEVVSKGKERIVVGGKGNGAGFYWFHKEHLEELWNQWLEQDEILPTVKSFLDWIDRNQHALRLISG